MKLERFKERNNKRIGIIVFTVVCVLLVSGVILYRTFAIFEVKTNQNVINGTVQDPGDIYFAFYQKNEESGEYEIQKEMPNLKDGYVLDEVQSYCGVSGEKDPSIEVYLSEDGYIKVKGMKTSRTKCNLYFAKGVFIQGKGIPVVTSGDGLYLVEHPASETEGMDDGWQQKEYRFAGVNPNNYVWFNKELWRIIGFVNVKVTKEDGSDQIEQRLKIVRNALLSKSMPWDNSNNSNDWTKSSLMKYLNTEYYNGNVDESLNDITSKNMIDEEIIWNIGGTSFYLQALVKDWYKYERGTETSNSHPFEWKKENSNSEISFHSIGIIYPSDYGYATSGETLNRDECILLGTYSWSSKEVCKTNDWLFFNKNLWTLTPKSDFNGVIYNIFPEGNIVVGDGSSTTLLSVLPTLYLKSSAQIVEGTGTSEDAFQIELK